jgi:hypothetical protein
MVPGETDPSSPNMPNTLCSSESLSLLGTRQAEEQSDSVALALLARLPKRALAGFLLAGVVVGGVVGVAELVSRKNAADEAREAALRGPSLERCLDEPLAADTWPIYPELPEYERAEIPPSPQEADYETTDDYMKALDEHLKELDAGLIYKSPEQIAYEEAVAAYEEQTSPTDIRLELGPYGVKGQPTWLYDVRDRVEEATVIIQTPGSHGTGFAVQDEATSDTLLVTAAHVVGTDGIHELSVTKPDGSVSTITDGCFIYDDGNLESGRFADLENDSVVEADVAVLRLSDASGLEPLALSSHDPVRGDWVGLVNFQATIRISTTRVPIAGWL